MNRFKHALLVALAFAAVISLSACKDAIPSLPEELSTGTITGKAVYQNAAESSGITITLEKTDGLRSMSVVRSIELGVFDSSARSVAGNSTTDREGNYIFTNVEEGVYTIYASSKDSTEKAVTTNVVVEKNANVTAEDLKLTATGNISGKITLNNSETESYGFLTYVAGTSYSAMTDRTGAFTISGIPAGTGYSLIVTKQQLTYIFEEPVTVIAKETVTVPVKNFSASEITAGYTNGKDGISINWLGSFASENEIEEPRYLDAYFNTADGCSYIYDGENWTLLATKGEKGENGTSTNGNDGTSISWLGSFASEEEIENPKYLDAYFNTADGCSYIYDGEKWTLLANKGANGISTNGNDGTSIKWLGSFASAEEIENPEKLNAFYNTTDGCSYIYDGEKWNLLAKGNAEIQDEHSHTHSDEWSGNSDFHWHVATCEHTDQLIGFEPHDDEIIEMLKSPGCLDSGAAKVKCSICERVEIKVIPPTGHKYSDEWSYDDKEHWRQAICSHSLLKIDYKAHNMDVEVIRAATESQNKIEKHYCTECNYGYAIEVYGSMIHEHHYDEHFVCDCGKTQELTVEEFLTLIGTSVTTITADASYPGITKSEDGTSVNIYGVMISGKFSRENHFPRSLVEADLTGLDTSKVTYMGYMFYGCFNLTNLNISNLDTSNVINMTYMFYDCNHLTSLDLYSFDTSKVRGFNYMFANCSRLHTIYWITISLKSYTSSTGMFLGCGDLHAFNPQVVDIEGFTHYCSAKTDFDL